MIRSRECTCLIGPLEVLGVWVLVARSWRRRARPIFTGNWTSWGGSRWSISWSSPVVLALPSLPGLVSGASSPMVFIPVG